MLGSLCSRLPFSLWHGSSPLARRSLTRPASFHTPCLDAVVREFSVLAPQTRCGSEKSPGSKTWLEHRVCESPAVSASLNSDSNRKPQMKYSGKEKVDGAHQQGSAGAS